MTDPTTPPAEVLWGLMAARGLVAGPLATQPSRVRDGIALLAADFLAACPPRDPAAAQPPPKTVQVPAKPAAPGLPARVRADRITAGLSQVDLARAAAVTPSIVSRIEGGGRRPSPATLARLAAALGTTPAALLGEGEAA